MSNIFAKKAKEDTSASNADLLAMLSMLSNPEKFQAQMAQLEERERVCDEKIKLAGMADEIVNLNAQAKALLDEASTREMQSVEHASKTMGDALQEASSIIEKANGEAEMLLKGAMQRAEELEAQSRAKVEAIEAELLNRVKMVEVRELDLETGERELASFNMSRADYLMAQNQFQSKLQVMNQMVTEFAAELNSL